jgi:phosphocarrier protein
MEKDARDSRRFYSPFPIPDSRFPPHDQLRMLEKDITITNRLGLHARASAKLVQALHGFQAATSIAYRGKEINAKSIMGVMMLAAGLGAELRLRADGPDEEAAMAAMVDLFERKFDEGQ